MSMEDTLKSKSNQLNADDLIGGNKIIKITDVIVKVGQEQPVTIHYENEDKRPFKPCLTMRRGLSGAWGLDEKKYIGRYIELYRDPDAIYAGEKVGGIRIKSISDIDEPFTFVAKASKHNRAKITFDVLKPPTSQTKQSIDLDAFEATGKTNAEKGVEAYTSWIGTLDEDHKAALRGDINKRLTAIAKSVPTATTEEEELAV